MSTAAEALALLRAGAAGEAIRRLEDGLVAQPTLLPPLRLLRADYPDVAAVLLELLTDPVPIRSDPERDAA